MAFVVGLDLGTRSLKGAVFEGNARKFRLVDVFSEEIPTLDAQSVSIGKDLEVEAEAPDDLETPLSLDELIAKVLRERNLTGAEIVCALDSKDCGIRECSVPFLKDEQIERTVAFEAEHYFHAFEIEDVTLEWVKIGERAETSQLSLFAAPNDAIATRLGLLKSAGVDPVALDLDAGALINAFAATPYFDETKNALLLDLGATSTKIVLLEGGRIKKVRALRTGAARLDPARMLAQPAAVAAGGEPLADEAPFGDLSIEQRFQEIEDALRRLDPVGSVDLEPPDDPGGDAPIAIVSDEEYQRLEPEERRAQEEALLDGRGEFDYGEYLLRVGTEVQRTLITTQLDGGLDLICLTGGMSRGDETKRFFQDEFDVETVDLEFGESLPSSLPPERLRDAGAEAAIAVGLGLKVLGTDRSTLDFRKGQFRFEHRFDRLRFPLLNCAVLAFLAFLQLAYVSLLDYQREKNYATRYQQETAAVYKTFFEKDLTPGRSAVRAADAQRKIWEQGGAGDVGRFLPFVEVVRDISNSLATTNLYFTVTSYDLKLRLRPSSRSSGRNKTKVWIGEDTKIDLVVDRSDANLEIEKAFRTKSGIFSASTRAKKEGETWKVFLTLTPKVSYLRKFN